MNWPVALDWYSMPGRLSEYLTFLSEYRRTFVTTGAIAPSSRGLARALARPLSRHDAAARILEVGPGTGAVTREIVRHIGREDRLDIVELNDRFVELMHGRFVSEPDFQKVADQTEIFHMPVQDLPAEEPYDYIVSGLPLNNFPVELVSSILHRLMRLLRPGGTLSFFEYLAIRRVKTVVSPKKERRRLALVGRVVGNYLREYEREHDIVFMNLPPAVAHHLRNGDPTNTGTSHDAVVD